MSTISINGVAAPSPEPFTSVSWEGEKGETWGTGESRSLATLTHSPGLPIASARAPPLRDGGEPGTDEGLGSRVGTYKEDVDSSRACAARECADAKTPSTISFTFSPEETVGGRSPASTEASLKTTTGKGWTRRSTGEDAGGDTPFERGLACHTRSTQDDETDRVPDEVEVLMPEHYSGGPRWRPSCPWLSQSERAWRRSGRLNAVGRWPPGLDWEGRRLTGETWGEKFSTGSWGGATGPIDPCTPG